MQKFYLNFKPAAKFHAKILARFKHQLLQQEKLLLLVKSALPETLREFVTYAVINEGKVLLFTHSAVYASQLRFYANVIQENITNKAGLSHIDQVQIRLTLLPNNANKAVRYANIPSPETIKNLRSIGKQDPTEPLALALQNLSNTLERLSVRK